MTFVNVHDAVTSSIYGFLKYDVVQKCIFKLIGFNINGQIFFANKLSQALNTIDLLTVTKEIHLQQSRR